LRFFADHVFGEGVAFDDYLTAFSSFFALAPRTVAMTLPHLRSMRTVLADKAGMVGFESFCNLVAWFGPASTGSDLLANIDDVCSKLWFFGSMSKQEAEMILTKKKSGTFLVRFSETTPGAFTISTVGGKNQLCNHRITRDAQRNYLLKNEKYTSLHEILRVKTLKCKFACPGSPFLAFYGKDAVTNSQFGNSEYDYGVV